MTARRLLAGLIVVATAAFVAGTAIERNTEVRHEPTEMRGEAIGHHGEAAGGAEHAEGLEPFGVDIEAAPFVIAAALGSLALAFAAWRWPHSAPVLMVVALAMLAFAVLDVREVGHQGDEGRAGLAVLAAVIALMHLAAAAVAATMAARGDALSRRRARR
jgi:hypothetical protein